MRYSPLLQYDTAMCIKKYVSYYKMPKSLLENAHVSSASFFLSCYWILEIGVWDEDYLYNPLKVFSRG